jgi:ribosomal protein L37AE/L43A
MKCPHCDNDIDESRFPAGLSFCPYCGDSLPTGELEKDKLLFCPYCGQELFAHTQYCPHCGKELAPAAAAPATTNDDDDEAPILHETKEIISRAASSIKGTFSKDRKIKKLYKQWAEHSDLPPEELAALEQAALEKPPAEASQRPNILVMYLALGAAIAIVIIGLVLWLA